MSLLPTAKTPPNVTLANQTVLLWGPAKVGKSEFCSQAEPALFLATEAGLNHLNVFQTPIASWDDFLSACKEIAEGNHSFQTIVVDTVDNAYRMCTEYICKLHNIKHESDLGYGKGYALVNNEFYRVLNKLSLLPYGLFLISHAQEKEIESRTGNYTKMVPTLPEKSRKIVLGMCDLILFADFEDVVNEDGSVTQRRVIRTKPTKYYEAGDRTGNLPETLELNFNKFIAAYRDAVAANSNTPKPVEVN